MSLIAKIKLLFSAAKPAANLAGQLKEVGSGWKTIHFWVSLLGSAISLAASIKGFIPADISLIVTTALVASYNIMRGFDKTDSSVVHPPFQSTEFLMGLLAQLSNAVLALQQGGIASTHLVIAGTVLAGAMSIAQNLSGINNGTATVPAQPTAPKA